MSDPLETIAYHVQNTAITICRCGTLVDVFILSTERYVIIIDTLLNPATSQELLAIARQQQAGRTLLAINTHADWDHAWGNAAFLAAGIPIIGSQRCAERLRSPEAAAKLKSMQTDEPERFGAVQLAPPSISFADTLNIDAGDLTLQLFPTPGHQPDHIAIFIPELRLLFAGDAAEDPWPFVESAASLPELRRSLAQMQALEAHTALYCHAPLESGPALIERNLTYFAQLEQRCREALSASPAPTALDQLETFISWPFAEALATTGSCTNETDFYQHGHQLAIQAMLGWLRA